MYRQVDCNATPAEKFKLPFDGKLSEDNRWVILAKLIPWSKFEEKYAQQFSENIGAPAKSFRMALGALIIKEKLGTSDRETALANQRKSLSTILSRLRRLYKSSSI